MVGALSAVHAPDIQLLSATVNTQRMGSQAAKCSKVKRLPTLVGMHVN
jgi:hypothetical protein